MTQPSIGPRVVKLGGSLLSMDDLPTRLTKWLQHQSPRRTAIIVGGGQLVDSMRTLDARFHLDPTTVHWRCVDLLQHTLEIIAELLPQWEIIEHHEQLASWNQCATKDSKALVAVKSFYHRELSGTTALPTGWTTTTDSIAAALASQLHASELVLLKSRQLPAGMDWQQAASSGIVDKAFPAAIQGLRRVRMVDLKRWSARVSEANPLHRE